jgi:ubiquitin-protein ligase
MIFSQRIALFRPNRRGKSLLAGYQNHPLWDFHRKDGEQVLTGKIRMQGRWLPLEISFVEDFPFREPQFTFTGVIPTHPCVDESSGRVSSIWGDFWSPAAASANVILMSLISVIEEHHMKGKSRA